VAEGSISAQKSVLKTLLLFLIYLHTCVSNCINAHHTRSRVEPHRTPTRLISLI